MTRDEVLALNARIGETPFDELPRGLKIVLFEAWIDGVGLEFRTPAEGAWVEATSCGSVGDCVYRILVPEPSKPSIDWSHVAPEYKWLAQDRSGTAFLYAMKPQSLQTCWSNGASCANATSHVSFKSGNCDWKDSLVERPQN